MCIGGGAAPKWGTVKTHIPAPPHFPRVEEEQEALSCLWQQFPVPCSCLSVVLSSTMQTEETELTLREETAAEEFRGREMFFCPSRCRLMQLKSTEAGGRESGHSQPRTPLGQT